MALDLVTCKIDVYEIDGEEVEDETMLIRSHRNQGVLVQIVVHDKIVVVSGADLRLAAENAMRTQ